MTGGIVVERTDDHPDAYAISRQREIDERAIVRQAFEDIAKGDFDSDAVNAVMGRRAGSIYDYVEMRAEYARMVRVRKHAGTL